MQKYKKLLWAIAVLILVLPSCRKEVQNPTNLNFQVVDGFGNPEVNATVTLYQTANDYNNLTNSYAYVNTDGNGYAIFNNVNAISYFYDISRNGDCSTNAFTTNSTPVLSRGTTNTFTVVVNQVGYITFVNNSSSYPYQISIDNTYYTTLDAGYTIKATELTGYHSITVTQVGGSNSQSYDVTLTDCGTATVNFPH